MKNPAAVIKRAGRILYGEHWKNEFSRTFDISPRTLLRLLDGTEPVFPDLLAAVETALRDHGHALDELLAEFIDRE